MASDVLSASPADKLAGLARQAADFDAAHGKDGETITAVNAEQNRPLFASRVKVYPKLVHGTFRRLKWAVMAITLAIYYITPWLRWDRGPNAPDQAVLLDLPARRFYFFFIEIWPQEIYYLTGLLILASLLLFLVTSLAGRVWCGYTCPQTVWTDLFIYVERLFEGERAARIRLDKSPWSAGKLARKTGKHIVWLLIAIATGGAWVFYFADAPALASDLVTLDAPLIAYIFIGLFTGTTYLLGGIAREQVCTYMCPWPRIQGAMFDDDSLLVSYKPDRGEPRGPHKKGTSWDGRGDCIDCGQCVAACPMGIDIRDGMQLECIQCALCIDACNEIMDKVERPRNLIGYDTPANKEARRLGTKEKVRLIRPRTVIYSGLLLLVSAIMINTFATRAQLEVNVLRDRNPLFVKLSDGSIRNGYQVKILNMDHEAADFRVAIEGLPEGVLTVQGRDTQGAQIVPAAADSLESIKMYVILPVEALGRLDDGEADFAFTVENLRTGEMVENDTVFRGPQK
ncbi:cytochrome c oxidase accessory protein CcoG [Tepidicaulis sp.]|uniref:cytochrome c oxidase accessory protein CcoG n=1 Tax=Tepidicaulis sp. TaxID=1920809 RepID=UPI003B598FC7